MKNLWLQFRNASVGVKALGLVACLALAWGLLRVERSATVRGYFWLEQWAVEHWPNERNKWEIQKLAPTMIRAGILGPVRVEVEPGVSFLLDPRDLIAASILRSGSWQPEVWDSLRPALSAGGVFLDIGAHIGYFSLKSAVVVGRNGRVVAFEPNPETLAGLRANVIASNAGNVVVEPVACTDREQILTLYGGPASNTGMSSLASENVPVEGSAKSFSVRGRPIDDVVEELGLQRVDAIKIDVEGAEVSVLRGTLRALRRFHPKVVIEVMPEQLASFHTTPEDIQTLLKSAGYHNGKPLTSAGTDWEWTQ